MKRRFLYRKNSSKEAKKKKKQSPNRIAQTTLTPIDLFLFVSTL